MASNLGSIKYFSKTETDYKIIYEGGEEAKLNILNNHVFRYHMSRTGEFPEYPIPHNPDDKAKINTKRVHDYGMHAFHKSYLKKHEKSYVIHTSKIEIHFDQNKAIMSVYDKELQKVILTEAESIMYENDVTTQILHQHKNEYFFGGGMQNGRFSHKHQIIEIKNTNVWINGGVSSPCPFYWSSYGYGILRNTWQPGMYDFGSESNKLVKTKHEEINFDAFYFVNQKPKDILKDYYELTGKPIFMPEYAFYEAHLNAFNRDYWVLVDANTPGGILFEDGRYYKSYQPSQIGDKEGILESLNGEKDNYQFSARAMIDRYKMHNLPLGWFIPNDGYGSGYGQTESLDGDIHNLKKFAEYARINGVEVALWTESNLRPADPDHPKKGERDLSREVGEAGIVALKCDVAWIGSGYSFGLNAVDNANTIFNKSTKQNVRPFIIMVDGWAGTQRYAGIWSGDQTGGEWEYIRFHIPTYIGSGLSGLPVIGSDMDGIYGGNKKEINIRDYQWKTFTPLQLNMDGWGNIPKTPFSFDYEATNINRAYLKLKSMLIPYNYTIAHEATHGLPMLRAMLLEFPDHNLSYKTESQYQFMWGPYILVAPIYNEDNVDNNSLRNEIYLPDSNQIWVDFFSGEKYQGGKILNNVICPLWKIPVFIKDGAIIPQVNANNNPYEINRHHRTYILYPNGETAFDVYEDDGLSSDYLEGYFAKTLITTVAPKSNEEGDLFINIHKTNGDYKKMAKHRSTLIVIMASKDIGSIKAAIKGNPFEIKKVDNQDDFDSKENIYFFTEKFITNPYLKKFDKEALYQTVLMIKIHKIEITECDIQLKIRGYSNKRKVFGGEFLNENITTPSGLVVIENEITPNSIKLQWDVVNECYYYEIERDETIYTNISGNTFTFKYLESESEHSFRIRAVNSKGVSGWSNKITGITSEDTYKHNVRGVIVSCNLPCQPCQEISKLTDGNKSSLWHTNWGSQGISSPSCGNFIKLNFDLRDVFEIEKLEYIPRDDAGNGTFLEIQFKTSENGNEWSQLSDTVHWTCDSKTKTIPLNGIKLRFMELVVLKSIGHFGSGRQVLFYKKC